MGSSYFYLEFLLSWLSVLSMSGYKNPAIFALEYTLVPDATFPAQLKEALKAYEHVLEFARDASRVVLSGDSAGASIVLSLLMYLADPVGDIGENGSPVASLEKPGMAALISPWVTLHSNRYKSTQSDYLDAGTLEEYAKEYAGLSNTPKLQPLEVMRNPRISPGDCKDHEYWRAASPVHGFFVTYGREEVFAPEVEAWMALLTRAKVQASGVSEEGGIHAWPVTSLFLCSAENERLKGIRSIVGEIQRRIPPC